MNDEQRRKALGDFLRNRRARLSPGDVGLPDGSRRRAPGLRREEVAQLASISVTWYTWLEQGRDISVSEQVLDGIVAALKLSVEETQHLFRLAHKSVPPNLPPIRETISPVLQSLLDNLETSPAWVIDHQWNILAWNEAARLVFGDFATIPDRERNILRFVFTDKTLETNLTDWEAFARGMLGTFRTSCGKCVGEAWFTKLISDLEKASPEFRDLWLDQDVRRAPAERVQLDHPVVGELELDNISFQVNSNPELRVCVYTAAVGSETAEQIQNLIGSSVAN